MMRTEGSPAELQRRRVLAVQRVVAGYAVDLVADILGVSVRSIRRWVRTWRDAGFDALAAQPVPGRPPKLTRTQEKIALRWLEDRPGDHGFDSDLWTAERLAELIRDEWEVELNHRYLCRWLAARGFSPQRPQRVPRERDSLAIAAWLDAEGVRIKKKRRARADASFSLTKAGF
jgi:transposase